MIRIIVRRVQEAKQVGGVTAMTFKTFDLNVDTTTELVTPTAATKVYREAVELEQFIRENSVDGASFVEVVGVEVML